jgi:cobalt-zinc-cadmium efflux system membrane fusion protein
MMRYILTLLLCATLLAAGCDRFAPAPQGDAHDHAGYDDHEGHDEDESHDDHDDHEDNNDDDDDDDSDGAIELDDAALREFGIELAVATPGDLSLTLELSGEVVFNPDRVAHVAPRIAGVAHTVNHTVGDQVERGDVLATFDSRELASLKSEYIAALKRLDIAEANFQRERKLWEQKITPESEYLAARQAVEEARIAGQLAEQQLHATGLSEADVAALPDQSHTELTRYVMHAPIGGTIVERHLTQGEAVSEQPDDSPFVIADLSSVWVHLTVYPKDLDLVRAGQLAAIATSHGAMNASGTIAYISPSVGHTTRTATARVVLDNADRRWRPGMFVTAHVQTETVANRIFVPVEAVQMIEDQPSLFVRDEHGIEPRPVTLGRRSNGDVEITEGLAAGETYVARNAFALKAELNRASLEHAGHNH